MNDAECIRFLQERLPKLRLRWAGFRKVRRQVCKRLSRRVNELDLSGLPSYQDYLEAHSGEWEILDSMCRITISRFYRDRGVFDALRSKILPDVARRAAEAGKDEVRCWCAGCCSGEEAYTLQILWRIDLLPDMAKPLPLRIVATDTDPKALDRARKGLYPESSIKDIPEELIPLAFLKCEDSCKVRESFRKDITFVQQDVRSQLPEGTFSLIFCRNLVLTYFEEALQLEISQKIFPKLDSGGIFVVGAHESLPEGTTAVVPYNGTAGIYQKSTP